MYPDVKARNLEILLVRIYVLFGILSENWADDEIFESVQLTSEPSG